MSGDTDLIKLYSARILELAADIPHIDPLERANGSAKRRSPLCGSSIAVELQLTDGRISAFSQDVKACALGQAAASVVGAAVIGCDRATVQTARDQLKAMLQTDAPAPEAPFDELVVLTPAREYKNRHASIMLALEATLEAVDQALARKSA
ncbi:iron-sulfur cluster assembly scaffold protein [Thalassobius sp. Cn5-15]|uniref:iron-sulfur cluster assembly scaffold protein n=1 Tax=Thalassobius sp. Cn5-15 TaxID=2917763 RepID=UPI001EF1A48F|nr:iron-sulfur cluster assembly scaffold protein [Thalassobius sp. Cn5-15]MCG7492383.1 iron-sulfur cluster assembly scaffold protein [Thalassobius sp. Cn5-15]